MRLQEMKCLHCGRPFVDYARLSAHMHICAQQAQQKLDEDWSRRNEARGNVE